MDWYQVALKSLSERIPCGYSPEAPPSSEATSLAVMALVGADRPDKAEVGLGWLQSGLGADGSVPPYPELKSPGWPTPLAIVAAVALERRFGASGLFDIDRAKAWLEAAAGNRLEPGPDLGHDVTLAGWPWVLGTHSWQEPSAWAVLALRALGLADHPRTREGIRLLVDRLLPEGGCNYGNTFVLGQKLRPHVEPTGLTMLALARTDTTDPRVELSLTYLARVISSETTAMSLACALLGLAAHDRQVDGASAWLAESYERVMRTGASPFLVALLVLAAQARDSALVKVTGTRELELTR